MCTAGQVCFQGGKSEPGLEVTWIVESEALLFEHFTPAIPVPSFRELFITPAWFPTPYTYTHTHSQNS